MRKKRLQIWWNGVQISFEELMNPEACQNVLEALAEILGETPLFFTIRTSEEGGNITISLEVTCLQYKYCKRQKADLVDVEVMSNSKRRKAGGRASKRRSQSDRFFP